MDPFAHDRPDDIHTQPTTEEMEALARYLSNESSLEETPRIQAWIDSTPERRQMAEHARKIWADVRVPGLEWDTERVWNGLQQRRAASAPRSKPRHAMGNSRRWYLSGTAIMACALIMIGIVATERHRPENNNAFADSAEVSGRVFATRRGQQSTVRLPDGAEITLAADSRLRISEQYGQTNRTVYLEGNAQFSVQHDPKRPFVVHTKFGETRDLATVFVVTAYPSDTVQRVIVTDGRVVSIGRGGANERVILNPGDMGTLTYSGASEVAHNVDTNLYTAWTGGELRFADAPLKEIAVELERWYDVTITISNSRLAMRPLTVSLGKGTIGDAMRVIEQLLGTRTVKRGSVLHIEESAE